MASYLSTKAIPASERLIFALDVPSTDDAIGLVATLGEAVSFYKLAYDRWYVIRAEQYLKRHPDTPLEAPARGGERFEGISRCPTLNAQPPQCTA
ncbi:MAG: hypothetical protein H0U97_02615 [Gammaproteobacteria bacterium]|nr:hypothetical protein [Gammaproteobacteria bacterium]